ncbi:MAG: hypothetical protein IPI46_14675 [Bacteroidetes bacterium]|nr:hypothetical protein [Bacteroidota bacterium]
MFCAHMEFGSLPNKAGYSSGTDSIQISKSNQQRNNKKSSEFGGQWRFAAMH